MKNKLLIGLAVILVLIGIGVVVWLISKPKAEPNPAQNNPVTFPGSENATSTSGNQTISVAQVQTGSLEVRDFTHDQTTKQDPQNKTYFYLAGGVTPSVTNPPYQIFYEATHQYFGITLYKEPLGQYRKEAEQYLQKTLGLSVPEMCRLNYFVGVGPGVNDFYVAKNLGFTFCPGSTTLPE